MRSRSAEAHPMVTLAQAQALADVYQLSGKLGLLPLPPEVLEDVAKSRRTNALRAWSLTLVADIRHHVADGLAIGSPSPWSPMRRPILTECHRALDQWIERVPKEEVALPLLDLVAGLPADAPATRRQQDAYNRYVEAMGAQLVQESRRSVLRRERDDAQGLNTHQLQAVEEEIVAARAHREAAELAVQHATSDAATRWHAVYLEVMGESADGRSAAEIWAHRKGVCEHLGNLYAGAKQGSAAPLAPADLERYRAAADRMYVASRAKHERSAYIAAVACRRRATQRYFVRLGLGELEKKVAETEPWAGDTHAIAKVERAFDCYFEDPPVDSAIWDKCRTFAYEMASSRVADISAGIAESSGAQEEARENHEGHQGHLDQVKEIGRDLGHFHWPDSLSARHSTAVVRHCERIDAAGAREAKPAETEPQTQR